MTKFKLTSVFNVRLSINTTLSMYLLCSICISMLNGVWLLEVVNENALIRPLTLF